MYIYAIILISMKNTKIQKHKYFFCTVKMSTRHPNALRTYTRDYAITGRNYVRSNAYISAFYTYSNLSGNTVPVAATLPSPGLGGTLNYIRLFDNGGGMNQPPQGRLARLNRVHGYKR